MKKITLLVGCLSLFVLGSSFAMADETPAVPSAHFGVEGGINLSSFNGPTVDSVYASRLGFVGGLFLNLPFSPILAIQPELLYEQKGGKINDNDYRLDYVEVPVLLDVTLIGPFSVILGPSFSANVGSYGVATVNQGDVGVILGAELGIPVFLLSARYEVGLTDLNSDTKIQNGTFTLMAGISFM